MRRILFWPVMWGTVGLVFGAFVGWQFVLGSAFQPHHEGPITNDGIWVSAIGFAIGFAFLSLIIGYLRYRVKRAADQGRAR
jgi:hypothetical protein